MKLKYLVIFGGVFVTFFAFIFFAVIFFADGMKSAEDNLEIQGVNLSEEVLAHLPLVEEYCRIYGIEEYVYYILAIMQVESGGRGEDVMQSSESLGLAPNTLSLRESIEQGVKYFSELLASANARGCDINTVIQAYNYGGGFVDYIVRNGGRYTYELAVTFARDRALGNRVEYSNPIAVSINGGWRYQYGNMFYVQLVLQYLTPVHFDDEVVQAIMSEALKYEGWRYVFGGATPRTSFDCSGLVQWCYGVANISLPRTAQEQYNATQSIPLSQAQAGDLVFFHSTYNTSNYVTHVGILVSQTQMYHAGDPIGYADIIKRFLCVPKRL